MTSLRIILLVLAISIGHDAGATQISFPDLTALSPNGKLRLNATSPRNAVPKPRTFVPLEYTFRLTDVPTGRVIWERLQPKREGIPYRALVHDSGRVVIWTSRHDFLVIGSSGELVGSLDILAGGLPADDMKEDVRESTEGYDWAGFSLWYFFEAEGQSYLGVRTWWDRRIVIALRNGKQVADTGAVGATAAAAEREFVLATLRKGVEAAQRSAVVKRPEYSSHSWERVENLIDAINVSGRAGFAEAIPLLRILEGVPCFGSMCYAHEPEPPPDGVLVQSSGYDDMRLLVQLVLRRLGAKPAGRPVREMLKLVVVDGKSKYIPYHPDPPATSRTERVRAVKVGQSPKNVTDTIGAPDYILNDARPRIADAAWKYDAIWEYDMDAELPYTLRVSWSGGTVTTIYRLPPVWKDGSRRDKANL